MVLAAKGHIVYKGGIFINKSMLICCIITAFLICLTGTISSAESSPIQKKVEISKNLKKDFNAQHDKILKGKVPVTDQEIKDAAAAGDKLKDLGIEIQKIDKEIASKQVTIPTREEILSQINAGIDVIGQSTDYQEYFINNNPNDSSIESLINEKEFDLKRLENLRQLKSDILSDKISNADAWSKVLEIRDHKK